MNRIVIGVSVLVAIVLAVMWPSAEKPTRKHAKPTELTSTPAKVAYRCPDSRVVAYYQDKVGGFRDQRLDWSVDNIRISVGENMHFSHAVFLGGSNQLSCHYEWPSPDQAKTWIVVTVHLIQNQALQILRQGKNWQSEGTSKICKSAKPAGCPFSLKRKAKR